MLLVNSLGNAAYVLNDGGSFSSIIFRFNPSLSTSSASDWSRAYSETPWEIKFGSNENQILTLTGNYLSLFDF